MAARLERGQERPPDQAVLAASVSFARALRQHGLNTRVDSEMVFVRALAEVDLRRRDDIYWAASATFVHSPDERPTFNEIFERFWDGQQLEEGQRGAEHGESDPRMGGAQHGGEALPQFQHEGKSSGPVDGSAEKNRATREIPSAEGEEASTQQKRGVLAAYSPAEQIKEAEAVEYKQDELAAMRRLAAEIKRSTPQRLSRRCRPTRGGTRLDVRTTLRRSLGTDGEALRLSYTAPVPRPRRLLFICDVSGSMERYSRVLLASLKAVVGAARKAEAFVFATRLTRLTRTLGGQDFEQALVKARAEVPDWSGGTRIGQALLDFNRNFGRRGFARGAIVMIVSDGWDRGDPDVLAREVRRLQLQSRRLVWVNPRPMLIDEQPLAIGMRAAMPFVDDFIPGHDPRAVAGLAPIIGGLGSQRPNRRRADVMAPKPAPLVSSQDEYGGKPPPGTADHLRPGAPHWPYAK